MDSREEMSDLRAGADALPSGSMLGTGKGQRSSVATSQRSASSTRVQLVAAQTISQAKMQTKRWKMYSMFATLAAVGAVAVMLGVNLWGNELSKDSKPDNDAAELRMTDGSNSLVTVGTAESFALLTDLPKMPLEYLEAMDKLTFNDNGAVENAAIEGFKWFSSSRLILQLAPDGLERVSRQIEARRASRAPRSPLARPASQPALRCRAHRSPTTWQRSRRATASRKCSRKTRRPTRPRPRAACS